MNTHELTSSYTIYKISNNVDDMVYIGSTKNMRTRWHCHRCEAKKGYTKTLSAHMRTVGIGNCIIQPIITLETTKLNARTIEQAEINKVDKSKLLNMRYAHKLSKVRLAKTKTESKRIVNRTKISSTKPASRCSDRIYFGDDSMYVDSLCFI